MTSFSNITISAPTGTSQHGRQDLLCFPTKWPAVLAFFVANYLTHAFTLWRWPGEKTPEYVLASCLALLFPIAGTGRGLVAIFRHASWQADRSLLRGLLGFGDSGYEKRAAAKAGALAVLVRKHKDRLVSKHSNAASYFEHDGESWGQATLRGKLPDQAAARFTDSTYKIVMRARQEDCPDCISDLCKISGLVWMHAETSYAIVKLPGSSHEIVRMEEPSGSVSQKEELAFPQSSSLSQILLAIIQIAYASYTLAKNTGDEIQRHGYASFSLTVVPYIMMSFVNLLGILATPIYPCVYLVATSTLDEAQERGNIFAGHVGYIVDEDLESVAAESEKLRISRINCSDHGRSRPRRAPPGPDAPLMARSDRHRPIDVCFERRCPYRASHIELTVATGEPREIQSSYRAEYILCALIFVCIMATPITILVYVSKNYDTNLTLQEKILVLLWYAAGYVAGLVLLYYRDEVNVPSLYRMVHIMFNVSKARCLGGHRTRTTDYKKQLDAMSGKWLKGPLLGLGFLIGLGLGVWNFYRVAVGLLAFGDCRAIDQ